MLPRAYEMEKFENTPEKPGTKGDQEKDNPYHLFSIHCPHGGIPKYTEDEGKEY